MRFTGVPEARARSRGPAGLTGGACSGGRLRFATWCAGAMWAPWLKDSWLSWHCPRDFPDLQGQASFSAQALSLL